MSHGLPPIFGRPGARPSAGPLRLCAPAAALAALLAVGWSPQRAASQERTDPPGSEAGWDAGAETRPDVLLITVDTLRPDALGWVAGRHPTPRLDALAAGAFRFPAAVSPAPLTLPSHASILTGLLPRRHGVRDNGQVLADGAATLAEALADRGWTTGAFVSGFPLAAGFGLDRGFDRYDDRFDSGSGDRLERRAADTVAAALEWARSAPSPWFLWIHFYDPHDPYEPPAELLRSGEDGDYLGEVAAVDRAVGELLEGLAAASRRRPRLTVFTADHGESLGEHGEATHGFFIYQSTIAVPLVFHYPGRLEPGESDAAARLIDVAPTVIELLDLPAWPETDGVSLAPVLAGREQDPPPAYVESRRPWISYRWAPLRAVIDGAWKLIAAPRPELYHLETDPGETANRVDTERRRARALQGALREIERRPAAEAAEVSDDPETLARLRALGYAAGSREPAGEPPPDLPDPKDRVAQWNLLGEAEALVDRGRLREAVAKFDAVLTGDPDNPFALSRSGAALLEAADPAAALPRLERAVAVDPHQPETRRALAFTLNRLGRHADAADQWMEAVRLQPRRAELWRNLAGSLGLAGEPERAVEAFRRAVDLDPGDPQLTIRLAFAAHAAGDPETAAAELTRAADLTGPEAFPHAGALGLLLADLDRPTEARPWLARSRPNEPEYPAARYRLAQLLAAADETEAAAEALAEALTADPARRDQAAGDPLLRPLLPN